MLFVNPRSGGGKATRAGLAERARERGIDVIVLRPGDDLATLVADAVARGADALGIAGGDGSLAVVAAAALAHGLPFVCVPAGTRNHFALDLGLDRHDLVGSLDAFTDGVERRIDVAEVNGRLFLNNVSLGIYGDAVRQPDYRDAKARTLLETAAHVLGPSAAAADLRARGRPRPAPSRPSRRARLEQPLLARAPARARAPGRRSTAGSSASSSSTRRAPAGARDARGPPRDSRSPRPRPSTPESTARPSTLTPPLRFVIRPARAPRQDLVPTGDR